MNEINKDEFVFAPVLIPTLNRVHHLQRLIDSLRKNKLSVNTELFIGVDYPPSEKYVEGHKKVCEYITNEIDGFKKINVYFHDKNIGSCANGMFLIKKAEELYDRYIFSEDDNEFSPNFLEYVNRGLEEYKEDESVLGICGHAPFIEWKLPPKKLLEVGNSFNGWGTGYWNNKVDKIYREATEEYLEEILKNPKRAIHIRRKNKYSFYSLVQAVVFKRGAMYDQNDTFFPIDTVLTIYMMDKDYKTICPVLSKVRNYGDDGSGEHCGNANQFHLQEIDKEECFEYDKQDVISGKFIDKKIESMFYCDILMDLSSILYWLIWLIKERLK